MAQPPSALVSELSGLLLAPLCTPLVTLPSALVNVLALGSPPDGKLGRPGRLGGVGSPPPGKLGRPGRLGGVGSPPDGAEPEKPPDTLPEGLMLPEIVPPDPFGPVKVLLKAPPLVVENDELDVPPIPLGPLSLELNDPPFALNWDEDEALPVPVGPFK